MPRPCNVCSRPDRPAIDLALRSVGPGIGTFADVGRRFRVPDASLRRHAGRHLDATVLREIRASATVETTDLLQTLLDLIDDAAAVRKRAIELDQPVLLLRAGAATRDLLVSLMGGLGIDDRSIVDQLRSGEKLASAVGRVVRQHPRVGDAIAAELEDVGAAEMAGELRAVSKANRAEAVESAA